jgi:hypothetical protein
MHTTVEKAEIKVLKAYPADKAWNVVLSFPDSVASLKRNQNIAGSLEYTLFKIQSWTDEPVDLNEVHLAAINTDTNEYKLVKGDDASVPERVQYEMLSEAREAMSEAENTLLSK